MPAPAFVVSTRSLRSRLNHRGHRWLRRSCSDRLETTASRGWNSTLADRACREPPQRWAGSRPLRPSRQARRTGACVPAPAFVVSTRSLRSRLNHRGHRWLRRSCSDRLETTATEAGTGPPPIEPVEIIRNVSWEPTPAAISTSSMNGGLRPSPGFRGFDTLAALAAQPPRASVVEEVVQRPSRNHRKPWLELDARRSSLSRSSATRAESPILRTSRRARTDGRQPTVEQPIGD